MKVLPEQKTERNELNLRLGIKSSLPMIKEFFGTYLSFYLISNDSDFLDYSYADGNLIKIKEEVLVKLNTFFRKQLISTGVSSIEEKINNSPFLTAQIEPLQVALELYWKLAKINFTDGYAENSERSGGNRYPKVIHFSTNANILKNILSDDDGEIYKSAKDILFNWITSYDIVLKNTLEEKLLETLTIFSEETQVKIQANGMDLIFQQESIYKGLAEGNTVESRSSRGPVGPFRIMKKFISSSLHPYIEDNNSEFKPKDSISLESLKKYTNKVSTYLDLITRRTIIENDLSEIEETEEPDNSARSMMANNIIYFGSPGTGKSYRADNDTKGSEVYKVTFHPEYDYYSFVGGYKPAMNGKDIEYKFVPQVFTNAYIDAWNNYESEEPTKKFNIQIEEINRGNCAEIFGDLFQLLDRDTDGGSKYGVQATEELKNHLAEKLIKEDSKGLFNNEIRFPPNLSLIATMNTSDQSLFPMDSAFKRRWDWEYVQIDYNCSNSDFVVILDNEASYEWLTFLNKINIKIFNATHSQDKQIGNWFVNATATGKKINQKTFINKVLFYLWNDVFKDEEDTIFILDDGDSTRQVTYESFFPSNKDSALLIQKILEKHLALIPIQAPTTLTQSTEEIEEE